MFSKVLIANRGEIACRIASTCRRMGVHTVAVYSDADRNAKHVAQCDEAFHIGGAASTDSYLRGDLIVEVARKTGAQAIHPGYGFLSENEQFARACKLAGVVFIGPPGSAIEAMGNKSTAKNILEKSNVPLVPGYHGEAQDTAILTAEAERIGYPVLLKASAGGGGKGMRIVESADAFAAALASCQREAQSSFANNHILIEKYLECPRHIEVQIFADMHGNCVYLFERDCSVQRRHQKILEESPAPRMTEDLRQAMGEAAMLAAMNVGYIGAGTVEFLVAGERFYFMEMNTRLQVEHTVTEMITGQDLVEWQLRVAAGERLPLLQHELGIRGHALEARVYAENPDKNFLPSTGTLQYFRIPESEEFASAINGRIHPAAVRIDSGVREGDVISPYYDPMIAKVIVWGRCRDEAVSRMNQALENFNIVGVFTNISFLQRVVNSQAFKEANVHTGLITHILPELFPNANPIERSDVALAVGIQLALESPAHNYKVANPWNRAWRLNGKYTRTIKFECDNRYVEAQLVWASDGIILSVAGVESPFDAQSDGDRVSVDLEYVKVSGRFCYWKKEIHIFTGGKHIVVVPHDPLEQHFKAEVDAGNMTAPMPGRVVAVLVSKGQTVKKGDSLMLLEAMKMEHTLIAPSDGVVEEVLYSVGEQVKESAQLLLLSADETSRGG